MSSHEVARSVDLRHQGVSTQAIFFLACMGNALVKLRDNDQWVEKQFGSCQLGNSLRTKRLQKVAANMLAQPEQSLPKQNAQWADLKAAYRLFNNSRVTFDTVAEQHWQQTRQTKPGRYLLISDTTDIDHFSHQATAGLGQLGKGDGRGIQLHNCLLYNCDEKQIEGVAGALLHYRPNVRQGETRMQRLNRVRESELWGNLVKAVGSAPQDCQWIHVFDRGGDNFEAMCHIRLTGSDWVIRAAKLQRNVLDENGEQVPLKSALQEARVLGSYELNLRSRPGMKARTAQIEVSVVRVTFPRPRHHSPWVKQCGIGELTMNVVVVQEVGVPAGVTPIRWVLLTSLAVETFEDAWQVIEDYENRWLVEEYHKVLKTGCSVELHALRTADRLEPLIGLISVIGTRLFQLKLIGRSQREAKASTHVPSCWLKCLKLARPKLKLTGLTVYSFFRALASLGGFLGRKCDGEPGWQTIWHGYKKLNTLLDGMRLVGAI